MDYVGPFTFNFARYIIGGAVLIPAALLSCKGKKDDLKTLITGGVCCGIALGIASIMQQLGIMYTSVGKSGFITAMYIIGVPVIGLFLGKKCTPAIWLAVLLGLAGLYLLCMDGDLSVGRGDILLIICAVMFSVQILFIDHFSPLVNNIRLSCIQFFTAAIVAGIPMVFTETPSAGALIAAWKPLLYTGILSTGVAYTLQIVGQKNMNPTVASLIMSLESSISVLAGWVVLGERLSPRELAGCGVMFCAIVLAQLPSKANKLSDSVQQ